VQLTLPGILGVCSACVVACGQPTNLQDLFKRSDYRLSMRDRLRLEESAPIIVLGRVLDLKQIGQPHASRGDRRILVQLTTIKIDVEEVIKGEIRPDQMEFDIFTYSDRNRVDLGVPRYIPTLGQRRIYFLKGAGNKYRSIGDVTNYNLPVRSGSHQKGFCNGEIPGCCIAELLLTPGPDAEVDSFAALLYEDEYAASVLCSQSTALELVRHLRQSPDARIANAAQDLIRALPRGVLEPVH
jgi:hypothetical protein